MAAPRLSIRFLLGLATALAAPLWVGAQSLETPEPLHLAYAEGTVTVERDGQADPADINALILPGDRLRTEAGRAEVLLPDGSALDVDENSGVEFQSMTLFRLLEGRVSLTVAGIGDPTRATRYQIDTPVAIAQTEGAGEYRIVVTTTSHGAQTELAVRRGVATLATERASTRVRAGEALLAMDSGSVTYAQPLTAARFDAFDRFVEDRRTGRMGTSASAQYLPPDLRVYSGTLEQAGSWQYNEPYGYVWYPTVAANWQPYYDGYWASLPTYGWTWIGADYWAWPTHHYGRWGNAHGSWFWVPGRVWGPAWVSWAGAPGYVSWCPLGFDGRAVSSLSASMGRARTGWVVVPRTAFGFRGESARRVAVEPRQLPATTVLTAHRVAPLPPGASRSPRSNVGDRTPATPGVAVRRLAPIVDAPTTGGQTGLPASSSRTPAPIIDRASPARPLPNRSDETVPRNAAPRGPEPSLPHGYRAAPVAGGSRLARNSSTAGRAAVESAAAGGAAAG